MRVLIATLIAATTAVTAVSANDQYDQIANEMVGALAPEYQREREIDSIISSQEFLEEQDHYDSPTARINPIDGGYLIETDYYSMRVRVVYEQTGRIGPAQYHLEFDKPKPLKSDLG